MTPLQQHAVALARAGCWRLLDAIELEGRADDEQLVGLTHAPGARLVFGYCEGSRGNGDDYCSDCDGDDPDCDQCDGEGWIWDVKGSPGDVVRWLDSHGEPVELQHVGHSAWMSVADAEHLVKESKRLVGWLYARRFA